MDAQTPLAYLMSQLNGKGDFTAEWKRLSDAEKQQMRDWAAAEIAAQG